MTIRRCAAAVGAVALGLSALTACTKPTALATVTVGKGSVNTEADQQGSCWNGGKTLSRTAIASCLQSQAAPGTTVKVHSGDKVHLGVDPDIAKTGWVVLGTQAPVTRTSQPTQLTDVIKQQTYTTLGSSAGQLFVNQQTGRSSKDLDLAILKTVGTGTDTTEVWKVRLELVD